MVNNIFICRKNCGECCGIVPILRGTCRKFEHLQQKEVEKIIEFSDTEVIVFTVDGSCVFLDDNKKCVIHNSRPDICKEYGESEKLPCPYFKTDGRKRRKVDIKRTQRRINHEVDDRMRSYERLSKIKNVDKQTLDMV